MKQVSAKMQTMSKVAHSAHTTPMPIQLLCPVSLVNTIPLKPSMAKQTDKQAKNDPIQLGNSSHSPSSSLPMPSTSSTPAPRLKTTLYEERDTPTVPLPPVTQILTDAVHPSDLRDTPIPPDNKDKPDEERSLLWQNSRAWRDYAHNMNQFGSSQGKSELNKQRDAPSAQVSKSKAIISSAIIILTLLVLAILITSLVLGKV